MTDGSDKFPSFGPEAEYFCHFIKMQHDAATAIGHSLEEAELSWKAFHRDNGDVVAAYADKYPAQGKLRNRRVRDEYDRTVERYKEYLAGTGPGKLISVSRPCCPMSNFLFTTRSSFAF
jgi:hypothetical protein